MLCLQGQCHLDDPNGSLIVSKIWLRPGIAANSLKSFSPFCISSLIPAIRNLIEIWD